MNQNCLEIRSRKVIIVNNVPTGPRDKKKNKTNTDNGGKGVCVWEKWPPKNSKKLVQKTMAFHLERFNFKTLNLCGRNNFVWAMADGLEHTFHSHSKNVIAKNAIAPHNVAYSFTLWINGRFGMRMCRDTRNRCKTLVRIRSNYKPVVVRRGSPEIFTLNFTVFPNRNRMLQQKRAYFIRWYCCPRNLCEAQ